MSPKLDSVIDTADDTIIDVSKLINIQVPKFFYVTTKTDDVVVCDVLTKFFKNQGPLLNNLKNVKYTFI